MPFELSLRDPPLTATCVQDSRDLRLFRWTGIKYRSSNMAIGGDCSRGQRRNVLFVRQYGHAAGADLLELPAGHEWR